MEKLLLNMLSSVSGGTISEILIYRSKQYTNFKMSMSRKDEDMDNEMLAKIKEAMKANGK